MGKDKTAKQVEVRMVKTFHRIFTSRAKKQQMELVTEIVEARNFWEAWMSVRRNKGTAGIDKMSVEALDEYIPLHMDEIKQSICKKQYKASPVRRVNIHKSNGKQRPLGIPIVVDRVAQQATAQVLSRIFSDSVKHLP